MMFVLLVFVAFFVITAFACVRLLRMTEEDLRARLSAGRANAGVWSAAANAPVAWLLVSALGAVLGVCVFALDFTDSSAIGVLGAIVFALWVLATGVAVIASFWSWPAILVHPRLRESSSRAGRTGGELH
jgi:hypothetical protein